MPCSLRELDSEIEIAGYAGFPDQAFASKAELGSVPHARRHRDNDLFRLGAPREAQLLLDALPGLLPRDGKIMAKVDLPLAGPQGEAGHAPEAADHAMQGVTETREEPRALFLARACLPEPGTPRLDPRPRAGPT